MPVRLDTRRIETMRIQPKHVVIQYTVRSLETKHSRVLAG
jgi:hypothetical protein